MARLVAKGFTQTYGVDYESTFAPVAKMKSVRLLLSIAANKGWPLYQLDVKKAFLNGDLQESVYMTPPPGFTCKGEEGKVCKLRKAIYGLKQSPRAWFERFSGAMVEIGFRRCHADYSVFIKRRAERTTVLLVYVEDIVLTGDDGKSIQE